MTTFARSLLGIVTLLACAGSAASPAVKEAATRFVSGIEWQEKSVLSADFSCGGGRQDAILGTSGKEIVVAVFTQGLAKAPELLRFASEERKPAQAKIRLEDSALSIDDVQTLAGSKPPGYRPSKSCKGLRLSDDGSDAAHIYWDHDARRFDSWSQQ
ncbi:MAG: hypothetical protein V4508_17535 [Pseudomonadota bacterium]